MSCKRPFVQRIARSDEDFSEKRTPTFDSHDLSEILILMQKIPYEEFIVRLQGQLVIPLTCCTENQVLKTDNDLWSQ